MCAYPCFALCHAHVFAAKRLVIRDDACFVSDVAVREQLLSTVLSYSTQWLHLALETVFRQTIPSSTDMYARHDENFYLTLTIDQCRHDHAAVSPAVR